MPCPSTAAVKDSVFAIDRHYGQRDSAGAHPAALILRAVIQCSEEFEMMEEREVSSEVTKLRTDLTLMLARIEVSLREFF